MDNPPLPPEPPDSSSATKGIISPATREEIEENMRLVGRHFGKSKRRDFHFGANMVSWKPDGLQNLGSTV